jgi:MFS family permease
VVRIVGPLAGVSIIFEMLYTALVAFTALYLVDARGVPATLAAIYFGVPELAGMLGSPLAGFLSDRIGRRAVILAGMGLLGPSFLALTLAPIEYVLLPLVGIGIAEAMRMTVTEVMVLDSAPPHRRATILGGYYMLAQHSGGLAAPILGVLATTLGIGSAFGGVCIALTVLSIAAILGQRAFAKSPPTGGGDTQDRQRESQRAGP